MSDAKPRRGFRNVFATVLLGLFTGLGLLATVAVVIDWLQGVGTYFWQEITCTIESSEVVEVPEYGEFAFEVSYRYRFRGQRFRGDEYRHGYTGSDEMSEAQRLAARYPAGGQVPCWVDPQEPDDAYLRRANLWRGLMIFAPLLFVAVGGGSLWLLHGWGRARVQAEPGVVPPEKARPFKAAGILIAVFGLVLLVGVGFFVPFFLWPALQVVQARSWRPVPCEILSSGVSSHSGEDSVTYSVEALYRYEIGGREYRSSRYQFMGGSSSGYESKAEAAARIPAGAQVTCYVDPDDPFEAVIERGFTADYLFGVVPLIFVLVGGGGLAAVIAGARALKKDAARPSWTGLPMPAGSGQALLLPPVPAAAGAITLEPSMGRVGKLGCAAVLALVWNGTLSLFVWQLVQGWRAGEPDWFLTVVLSPFVLIGLALLLGIPYGVLALANPRPRLRLSRGAVPAGESAEIDWSFRGAAGRIRRLRIWLQAAKRITETETHDSGFSVRTRTEALEDTRIDVVDRGPEEPRDSGRATLTLPPGAPPTSQGEEAVRWKLHLTGEIRYWPDVAEEYEIEVLPPAGSEPSAPE